MKEGDSQKLVADIKDRTHQDLSIHASQRSPSYFLVLQKLIQSLYLTLCFKHQTLNGYCVLNIKL